MPRTSTGAAKPRIIRDKAFSRRLDEACDTSARVPAYNFGRLTWIRDQLTARFKIKVSTETVRKWFSGEARPRPDKLKKVAELLGVDEAWLSLGLTPEMEPNERQAYNATAPGVVNLVAGLIQLGGGHPAFPEGVRAKTSNLLAIIRGKSYSLYVTLGVEDNGAVKFAFPTDTGDSVVIGVVQTGTFRFDFLHLIGESLKSIATVRGGYSEISVKKDGAEYTTKRTQWPRIRTFSERLE